MKEDNSIKIHNIGDFMCNKDNLKLKTLKILISRKMVTVDFVLDKKLDKIASFFSSMLELASSNRMIFLYWINALIREITYFSP